MLTGFGAEVGGFSAIRSLAWRVAQRVQQAVALVTWHGVDLGVDGPRSGAPGDVGLRAGVDCAILAGRGAQLSFAIEI